MAMGGLICGIVGLAMTVVAIIFGMSMQLMNQLQNQ